MIYVCEHHDAVLSHWRQRDLREIRLAHVDFHDDLRGLLVDRRRRVAYLVGAAASGAVELDAESPIYSNNLATALARLERYEEAARAFEAVCERQPRFENAAFFAAASFSMAGMVREAAKWAQFGIDEGLTPATRFATDPLFANLRDSEYWDPDRGKPK